MWLQEVSISRMSTSSSRLSHQRTQRPISIDLEELRELERQELALLSTPKRLTSLSKRSRIKQVSSSRESECHNQRMSSRLLPEESLRTLRMSTKMCSIFSKTWRRSSSTSKMVMLRRLFKSLLLTAQAITSTSSSLRVCLTAKRVTLLPR